MVWVLVGVLAATDVALSIQLRRMTRELQLSTQALHACHTRSMAAIIFANVLADRGINVQCDDCGNAMGPDDQISILERPDGSTYVGHRSHNRHIDWGYQP